MSQQLYTTAELVAMSQEELEAARANGFVKPEHVITREAETDFSLSGGFPDAVGDPFRAARPLSSPQDPYAVTSWGSDLYDFTVPSGQKCQLRRLHPEELIGSDLLDKITRLPALADEQVRQAQGQPPMSAMPTGEQMRQITAVLNELLPLVVMQPKLWPEPDPKAENPEDRVRKPGRVYILDVDLFDRIAIMNRATQGVAKLDNFRPES